MRRPLSVPQTTDDPRQHAGVTGSISQPVPTALSWRMPDNAAGDWRLLELLAGVPEGITEAVLMAYGFAATTVTSLIDAGLATPGTERILAGGRTVNVTRLRITPAGRMALLQR
jgi:hypothetical protein